MKFIAPSVVLFTLVTSTFALPQLPGLPNLTNALLEALGLNSLVGHGPLPPILATTIHSPQCADVNGGTYVCCQDTFNGDLPIVVAASALTDYPLTNNSINGLVNCQTDFTECNPGTALCCGSIVLLPTVALYCQNGPAPGATY